MRVRFTSLVLVAALLAGPIAATALAVPGAYRTDFVMEMLNYSVRFSWLSSDGRFADARAPACAVIVAQGQFNGHYNCVYRSLQLRTVTLDAQGVPTYEFDLWGLYGSPYIVDVFSPYGTGVGQRGASEFLLHARWTPVEAPASTPLGVAGHVEIGPGSRVGPLSTHGWFAVAASREVTTLEQP